MQTYKRGEDVKLDVGKLLLAMANSCMNATELADKSKVSRGTLTKCLSGKSNPRPATIGMIAKALDVSVEDLIERRP